MNFLQKIDILNTLSKPYEPITDCQYVVREVIEDKKQISRIVGRIKEDGHVWLTYVPAFYYKKKNSYVPA